MTLEDVRDRLGTSITLIEKTIESFKLLDKSYEDLMENASWNEVAGLKRPSLVPYIQELLLQREILLTLKFHVECAIEDNEKRKKIKNENKKR